MTIGINDSLDEFEALCIEREACQPALDYIAAAKVKGWTVRNFIDNAQIEHPEVYGEWALWCRLTLPDAITFATKLAFAKEAMRNDARTAALIDVELATAPSEGKEAASAWSAEQFPQIAKELEEGVVQRSWQ